MERALALAHRGEGSTSPNPMVGAVIVDTAGRIIGEGWHRRCGEGHAEVNAVASVSDKSQLRNSTMYVTLEPCSHYGKTPPCARLLIDCGIPRVVVGSLDPNERVSGRGVRMLRQAGVEVKMLEGDIARRCKALNKRFMTAHSLRRPHILLKWAQSRDGYMDINRGPGEPACRFSTPLSTLMMHRERSLVDAIVTGSGTVIADSPRFTVRGWDGRSPRVILLDRQGRVEDCDSRFEVMSRYGTLGSLMGRLFSDGIISVMVEAGPTLLKAFIDASLWDEARVEVAPVELGDDGIKPAPRLPMLPDSTSTVGPNTIYRFTNRCR